MTSSKLLLVLMAAALSRAAPQINERQVVQNVITQLGPAIAEALSSFNLGGSSASNSKFSSTSRSTPALSSSRFSSSSVPQLSSSRFSTGTTRATQSSFRPSTSSSSASASSLTSSVISSLQPAIAAAVAEALGQGSRRSDTSISTFSGATAGWDGPLAGVHEVQVHNHRAAAPRSRIASSIVTPTRSQDTRVSQSDLMTLIISSLQPQISSAVQSALSSSSNNARFNTNTVSGVQRSSSVAGRQPGAASRDQSLVGLFGVQGENNVRIETPDFNVAY